MTSTTNCERFFVLHRREADRPSKSMAYEIQVLNNDGQAIALGHVDATSDDLRIDGRQVPRAVIEAARRQPLGQGDYVDALGQSVAPF